MLQFRLSSIRTTERQKHVFESEVAARLKDSVFAHRRKTAAKQDLFRNDAEL